MDPTEFDDDWLPDDYSEPTDAIGDGVLDGLYMAADLNGDGMIDAEIVSADTDGDGIGDYSLVTLDGNHDGIADVFETSADLNQDGIADVASLALDLNQDGIADAETLSFDFDGDGVADVFADGDSAQAIWEDSPASATTPDTTTLNPLIYDDTTYDDLSFSGYNELYEVHGTPAEDMALWDPQDDPMSCAVATTNMMFRSVGLDIGEDSIAEVFEQANIYDPAIGTNPHEIDDVINAMARANDLDLHAEEFRGFTPDSLEEMLEQGIRPLIAVDSAELHDSGRQMLNELGIIPQAGHAVQLIGIERGEDGDYVVINDPGFPEGAGYKVPMERFRGAAEDYGFLGVAVIEGAPDSNSTSFPWLRMAVLTTALATSSMGRKKRLQ